ncbi:MAG: hypothetical protein QOF83_3772 [Solirubrobacteraceae bacterium]|nr:hypothetical protein [Solirubrobacteraceae bacterium]
MFTPQRTITAAAIAGMIAIAAPHTANAASMPHAGATVGASAGLTGSLNPGNHGYGYGSQGNHGHGYSWNQGHGYGNGWNKGNGAYGNLGASGSVSGGASLPGASTGLNLGATAGLPGAIGVGATTGAGLGLS